VGERRLSEPAPVLAKAREVSRNPVTVPGARTESTVTGLVTVASDLLVHRGRTRPRRCRCGTPRARTRTPASSLWNASFHVRSAAPRWRGTPRALTRAPASSLWNASFHIRSAALPRIWNTVFHNSRNHLPVAGTPRSRTSDPHHRLRAHRVPHGRVSNPVPHASSTPQMWHEVCPPRTSPFRGSGTPCSTTPGISTPVEGHTPCPHPTPATAPAVAATVRSRCLERRSPATSATTERRDVGRVLLRSVPSTT
jgi:hypothetical protein